MFTHQSRLRHLLRPPHYFDDELFARERERLYLPAWHLVGTASETPREGDFRTLDLLGVPLIVRNAGGQVRAFRNVCPHRHAMLTSSPCGHAERLRCQYHGWEFQDDGRTGRIPEAHAFRPWDRENARLTPVRLEACGDLLFATLDELAPPLEEWLHPFYEETADAFDPSVWRMRKAWDYACESNWKVPAENTLESYHVTSLHPKWFGQTLPREDHTTHRLEDRFTALDFVAPPESAIEARQARLCEWLGGQPTSAYRHRHIHPNTVLCLSDTLNYALAYHPLSPTRTEVRVRLFAFRGTRRGPLAAAAAEVAWQIGRRATVMVHKEDLAIYADQQRGLEAAVGPGVIGAREERIHYFQRYVLDRLGLPEPPDPAADADSSGAGLSDDVAGEEAAGQINSSNTAATCSSPARSRKLERRP